MKAPSTADRQHRLTPMSRISLVASSPYHSEVTLEVVVGDWEETNTTTSAMETTDTSTLAELWPHCQYQRSVPRNAVIHVHRILVISSCVQPAVQLVLLSRHVGTEDASSLASGNPWKNDLDLIDTKSRWTRITLVRANYFKCNNGCRNCNGVYGKNSSRNIKNYSNKLERSLS